MIKRFRPAAAIVAALAIILAVFTGAPAANAADDWGTTWGFTYYPLTTQDHCAYGDPYGPLVFDFEAYRSGIGQVTVEWKVQHHGVMAIRAWNTYGPDSAIHYFDSE